MANKQLITPMDGTPLQIVLADNVGDFGPEAANDLRVTTDGSQERDGQLTIGALSDGAYAQSSKFDLGENWAECYRVRTSLVFDSAPTADEVVKLWFGGSQSSTPANGNPAGQSGVDGAYTGYSSNPAEAVKQLFGPLLHICTVQAHPTVQIVDVGLWYPKERHNMLVVGNFSDANFHADDADQHIVLDPVVREQQ
jgi:hypothetical protein